MNTPVSVYRRLPIGNFLTPLWLQRREPPADAFSPVASALCIRDICQEQVRREKPHRTSPQTLLLWLEFEIGPHHYERVTDLARDDDYSRVRSKHLDIGSSSWLTRPYILDIASLISPRMSPWSTSPSLKAAQRHGLAQSARWSCRDDLNGQAQHRQSTSREQAHGRLRSLITTWSSRGAIVRTLAAAE